jgi:Fic family protein
MFSWTAAILTSVSGATPGRDLLVGTKVVRFQPVSAADTPRFMHELHERFDRAWHDATCHRLLLLAAYVFDFLMVHPFQDGNGRMSRLITSLLLHHCDYEVGRYVSWEKKIHDTRDVYYEALQRSTIGWHEGDHDLKPWLAYLLGVLVASYAEFEERADAARRDVVLMPELAGTLRALTNPPSG